MIVSLGFLMNFAIRRHNDKKVDKINVTIGNSDKVYFVTEKIIRKTIDGSSKNGKKAEEIKDLDIIKTEENLDKNPFITWSNVYVDLDGNVNVDVVQKVPVVRVKTAKEEFYLDENGGKFPLSSEYSYPCLLAGGNVKPDEYRKLAYLAHNISVDNLLKNHIIAIEKEKKNSYNLFLNLEGVYIEFGDLKNCRQKLTNLKEFYKQYLDKVGFEPYSKISVKYNNQIVATKR
ncbi:MAG: cell division protein FtsQ [Flavobacteriaceae bacterium]|nr:cell division protein FtsQ [Flavobacteriaceae bacterium]